MRILVEIGHPAHVHFFKNPIRAWKSRGHAVLVASREKDMANALLRAFDLDAISLSKAGRGAWGLLKEMVIRDYRLWRVARRFKPDILTSIGGTWISQISKIIGKPAVVFYDTENAVLSNAMTYPLVAALCTPKCYELKTGLGEKHLRYPGYHELSYLHPNRFQPDPGVLTRYHVTEETTFFIIRFVGWGAGHDLREKGLSMKQKKEIIDALSERGPVFVSSEAPMSLTWGKRVSPVSSEHIHHLMAFAALVVGESATMTSEAAVLGVPAIYIADTQRGYTREQEYRYGLVFHFTPAATDAALKKIQTLLNRLDLRGQWRKKRQEMLYHMIDVSPFVVETIEQFPGSIPYLRRKWADLQRER